jgi:predicted phage tail protein
MSQMRTIRLYGKLGAKFGRVHRFAVSSLREAISAMCVMIPGFEHELMNSRDRGIAYAVFLGKRNLAQNELHFPVGKEDIRIAPVLQGSKQAGLLQTVLGVVLVVVGAFISEYDGGTTLGLGITMLAGGVLQMLAPQQQGLSSKDSPQNGASYNFNGPVNVEAQGNPEPLLYGEMIVGSVVISGGIYSEDQA